MGEKQLEMILEASLLSLERELWVAPPRPKSGSLRDTAFRWVYDLRDSWRGVLRMLQMRCIRMGMGW